MKQLVYVHTLMKPLVVVCTSWLMKIVVPWLTGVISRWIPGAKGRRIIGWTSFGVSILAQIVCLVVLSELISLCIDLAELWTLLAHKHLEITLDQTS